MGNIIQLNRLKYKFRDGNKKWKGKGSGREEWLFYGRERRGRNFGATRGEAKN